MATRRKNTEGGDSESESENEAEVSKRAKKEGDSLRYEQIRDQRIKENMERMQKLGLLELSLKLKQPKRNPQEKKKTTHNALPSSRSPPRRSSRIMTLLPVNYSDSRAKEKHESSSKENEEEGDVFIPEGTNPEIYTEEQEKLLGDCETAWELNVDGCDADGNRIYDPFKGMKCHQCRHKTLGQYTICNKCELLQGQICGDCLYTRYGENVIEANQNPKWSCPACRGICNCSGCRKANGWMPTGNIYRKVSKLGFKSVAHYLIQTRRCEISLEGSGAVATQPSANTTSSRPRTRRALMLS